MPDGSRRRPNSRIFRWPIAAGAGGLAYFRLPAQDARNRLDSGTDETRQWRQTSEAGAGRFTGSYQGRRASRAHDRCRRSRLRRMAPSRCPRARIAPISSFSPRTQLSRRYPGVPLAGLPERGGAGLVLATSDLAAAEKAVGQRRRSQWRRLFASRLRQPMARCWRSSRRSPRHFAEIPEQPGHDAERFFASPTAECAHRARAASSRDRSAAPRSWASRALRRTLVGQRAAEIRQHCRLLARLVPDRTGGPVDPGAVEIESARPAKLCVALTLHHWKSRCDRMPRIAGTTLSDLVPTT